MCSENVRDAVSADLDRPPSRAWKIVATSVRGRSHERLGMPCQDAQYGCARDDGVLLVAVADGAGSAEQSDVGAEIASRTAVESLGAEPDLVFKLHDGLEEFRPILIRAFEAALQAVEDTAAERDIDVRDLASTLIVVAATQECVAVGQVGDGAAVLSDSEAGLIALTAPDSGEYINQTTFLVTPGALDTAQVHVWFGQPDHIALFSDGLQMLALTLPFGKPHGPFFGPLFRFISKVEDTQKAEEQLASFLRSDRVRDRTDDDVTLMLAALTDCTHATGSQI